MNHQLNAIAAGIESFNAADPDQVEKYSKQLEYELDRHAKLQAIGAGIEDSGTICLRDVKALEALYPGLMDASGHGGQEFTIRPSLQGLEAGLEAIDWAKVGKWYLIAWLIFLILGICGEIFNTGARKQYEHNKDAFRRQQERHERARRESQDAWRRANSSYSGSSNKNSDFGDDWFKDFKKKFDEDMKDFNAGGAGNSRHSSSSSSSGSGSSGSSYRSSGSGSSSSSSSGGSSYQEQSRRANEEAQRERANKRSYDSGGSNEQERAQAGAEKARNRSSGATNAKARANVELMDEFEKVTRFFLKEGKTGFASSQIYTSGGWTIEHVIKQKIEYWMLCGPQGHFQYKETFFYNPDKSAVGAITALIKQKGNDVKAIMPDIQAKFDGLMAIDEEVKGLIFQGKGLFSSGNLTDDRVTPFINKIAVVGRSVADKIAALPDETAHVGPAERMATEMQSGINQIWPMDNTIQNQYKEQRKVVNVVTVDPSSIDVLYSAIAADASALAAVESGLKKAHDNAEHRKKEANSPITPLIDTIRGNTTLSADTKHQLIQNLTALNRQYNLYGDAVIKSYHRFQKGLAHLAQFFKRIKDATNIVTQHLEYETKMENRFKKLYDCYAKA